VDRGFELAGAPCGLLREGLVFKVDTVVNFLCPLISHVRDVGGTIATTSSPAGFFGLPKSSPYSASKAATRILFGSCRVELAHTPLRFVTLFPGCRRP
jgi:NADP-dependent 3-hydroxy acid dehydrogenase YdfG